MSEWQELTEMTRGEPIRIERVRVVQSGIRIEGDFELPPLGRLTFEDQVFIAAFVRCHGSIKEMEVSFGISYPTVKNRLNKIAGQLGFVAAEAGRAEPLAAGPAAPVAVEGVTGASGGSVKNARKAILARLERGELTADQAVEALKRC